MEQQVHPFHELFNQLGLDSDAKAIDQFCLEHAPLDDEIKLADAPFWTETQKQFLRESVQQDADWAPVVDQLNLQLRAKSLGK
ncbi:MAG TPA: DUF2789 domain-containing protein [Rhodocyclaceae bacterium]|jgi:hypothetical protein|nr:DUF2789 domain-containing protein [Rhodocyclaceae bacterium]